MHIRKTKTDDIDEVCDIFNEARAYMKEIGNPNQWGDFHPVRDLLIKDIEAGKSYVCIDDNDRVSAYFYFNIENDPTYAKINGSWLNDEPYGVVHRIAKRRDAPKGSAEACIRWCLEQCDNVRLDTHKDNIPMLKLAEKLNFTYCGIIWIASGDERMAFHCSLL